MGKSLDSFETPYEKRLYKKLMQILNDPTHPVRFYTERRCSTRKEDFYPLKQNTNRHKASFLPAALSVVKENDCSY